MSTISRREAIALLAALAVPRSLSAGTPGPGRLTARPGTPTTPLGPGRYAVPIFGLDVRLMVPPLYKVGSPAPLMLMLHGAGDSADHGMQLVREAAAARGMLVLAPTSVEGTWDGVRGELGADVATIDRALDWTFARFSIDPEQLVVAGFSDGASYALTMGLINGDLFRRIIAFSPGYFLPRERHGKPRVYISHGTRDRVLSIGQTPRRVVRELESKDYDVLFREFDGPHTVPAEVLAEAMEWLDA